MEKVIKYLFDNQDEEYGDFIHRLTPTIERENFIGVRVPLIRSFVNKLTKEEQNEFLNELPHKYYEEGLLHGFIIQKIKDYDTCINRVEEFLPYINNWATSDTILPKCFIKNSEDVFLRVNKWLKSEKTYTVRFALLCLMNVFLDDKYRKEYLELPLSIDSEEYYINMMIAWYYATALAKHYDDTVKIIESKRLKTWIHNKAIQKACESSRVEKNQKEYLRNLKK